MVIEKLCPVCGYEMDDPPTDHNICPSCGTEFGLHDVNASLSDLRAAWMRSGPKWWSATDPQPANWNPFAQLAIISAVSGAFATSESMFTIGSSSGTSVSDGFIDLSGSVGWTLSRSEDIERATVAE